MRQVFDTSVYRYRNQCAHNTQSYQSDLPTMETLQSLEYRYANYFIRFFILVLVDNIFRYLYGEYQEGCLMNSEAGLSVFLMNNNIQVGEAAEVLY